MSTLNFYMDDSGTRKPDRAALTLDPNRPNHFALGGVLVSEDDEEKAREAHAALCSKWSITYPLHSVDIRHAAKEFEWLRRDSPEYGPFMADLTQMLVGIPVTGLACVIDRPGYDARYRQQYGRNQWQLCRTAFSIAVERAAKHARRLGCKLRIFPERSSKDDERRIGQYYEELRNQGLPFDSVTSNPYAPLTAADCAETLVELKFKFKSSPMAQIADLYLWPILWEKYRPGYRPYQEFRAGGRLIECVLDAADVKAFGSKFSCFELVEATAAGTAAAQPGRETH
jgi:hypothetical protein